MMERWLEEAFGLAKKAESEDEVPVGAVVVLNSRVIGRGYNRREALNDPTEHAEMMAIREAAQALASWRLPDCELFVTLEPCPMCLSAAQQARIRKIVYGAQDPKGGALSLGYELQRDERLNHRFSAEYVPHAPSSEILKSFFKKKRTRSNEK